MAAIGHTAMRVRVNVILLLAHALRESDTFIKNWKSSYDTALITDQARSRKLDPSGKDATGMACVF